MFQASTWKIGLCSCRRGSWRPGWSTISQQVDATPRRRVWHPGKISPGVPLNLAHGQWRTMMGARKSVRLWREEVVAAFRFPWVRGKQRFRISVTVSVSTQGANHELYRHRPPQEDYQRVRGQPRAKGPQAADAELR